jgi:HD-GYP domain-containing protein (c-di-GMP phosphodiesterase class II)
MENHFSIFDLERRKQELARERGSRGGVAPVGEPDLPPQERSPRAEDHRPASQLLDTLEQALEAVLLALREGREPVAAPLVEAMARIVAADQPDRFYEHAALHCTGSGHAERAVFTALAAMKIGAGLGFDRRRLLHLGLTGLLHDIGLARLPGRLAQAHGGALSPQDKAKLRTLPQVSAQIVERLGPELAPVAEAVAQVCERVDGSGHPMGLRDKQIAEPAAIVGLVAHIVALREPLAQANPYIQPGAIRQVVGTGKERFPRRVLKEFLDQISLFPVNTLVRLNNDSIGRVVATYRSQPMRPGIELLYDGLGKRKDAPKRIDLPNFPLLHVVGEVDAAQLAGAGQEAP